mmetsp:Transcript_11159/g.39491  ORF Transcript_11159/g.39491 Transcript_11159/m.39491 type:complete len:549 (+) Transcript_11159:96-1742(+)
MRRARRTRSIFCGASGAGRLRPCSRGWSRVDFESSSPSTPTFAAPCPTSPGTSRPSRRCTSSSPWRQTSSSSASGASRTTSADSSQSCRRRSDPHKWTSSSASPTASPRSKRPRRETHPDASFDSYSFIPVRGPSAQLLRRVGVRCCGEEERCEEERVRAREEERRSERRRLGAAPGVPGNFDCYERGESERQRQRRRPEQERQRVGVPDAELKMQRPRAGDAHEVGREEHFRRVAGGKRAAQTRVSRKRKEAAARLEPPEVREAEEEAYVQRQQTDLERRRRKRSRAVGEVRHGLEFRAGHPIKVDGPVVLEAAAQVERVFHVGYGVVQKEGQPDDGLRRRADGDVPQCARVAAGGGEDCVPRRGVEEGRHLDGDCERVEHARERVAAFHEQEHGTLRERRAGRVVEEPQRKDGVRPPRQRDEAEEARGEAPPRVDGAPERRGRAVWCAHKGQRVDARHDSDVDEVQDAEERLRARDVRAQTRAGAQQPVEPDEAGGVDDRALVAADKRVVALAVEHHFHLLHVRLKVNLRVLPPQDDAPDQDGLAQ